MDTVTTKPSPRASRDAAVRERILDAAVAMIRSDGLRKAQMSLIAHAAGVGVGSLYKHFPSQAVLLAEIYDRYVSHELVVLREVSAQSDDAALDRLATGLRNFCERSLKAGNLAHALMVEPAGRIVDEHRLQLREAFRVAIADLISEAVREGALSPHDVTASSAAVVGIMTETLVGPLSGTAGRKSHRARAELITTMALGAVQAAG